MNKKRFRGNIKQSHGNLFFQHFLDLENNKIIRKKYFLTNEFVNEFFYKKYKNAKIEFSALVEIKDNKHYLKNINDIKTNDFYYSERERRTSLANVEEDIFIGKYVNSSISPKTNNSKFLFTNIKSVNGSISLDHVFLEFNSKQKEFKQGSYYIFIGKVKKYKKGYSDLDFYGFEHLNVNQISLYLWNGIKKVEDFYSDLYFNNKNKNILFSSNFEKYTKQFLYFDLLKVRDKQISEKITIKTKKPNNIPFELIPNKKYILSIKLDKKIIINKKVNVLVYFVSKINYIYLEDVKTNQKEFTDCEDCVFFNLKAKKKIINMQNGEIVKISYKYKQFYPKVQDLNYFSANILNGKFMNIKSVPNF